ncbi:hypothetical protein IMZ48_03150 [Candidatus Bathyarchaeota archaeon]|nr:hypothetical protein [Candidatus Bathyarchaeota archaeon]
MSDIAAKLGELDLKGPSTDDTPDEQLGQALWWSWGISVLPRPKVQDTEYHYEALGKRGQRGWMSNMGNRSNTNGSG